MYVEEAKSVSGDNDLSANPADWDTGPLCFLAKKYKEFFNEGKKDDQAFLRKLEKNLNIVAVKRTDISHRNVYYIFRPTVAV